MTAKLGPMPKWKLEGGNGCSRFSGAEEALSLGLAMTELGGVNSVAEFAEAFYDSSKAAGLTPSGGYTFDKRMLLPLSQLPEMVMAEAGESLPGERLERLVEDGWIPKLQVEDTGKPGFALYAPSRVGLLLQLERAGYSAAELRAIAAYEEGYIDNVLVNDETPYLDDDREQLLTDWRLRLIEAEAQLARLQNGELPASDRTADELRQEIEAVRRSLSFLEDRSLASMTPELREKTARMAYRVRFFNELIRVQLLEHLRGQIRAGYSPFLHFNRASYPSEGLPSFSGVFWDGVLDSPWVEEGVPIRLPELLLDGDRITQVRPLRPSEYEELWERYDLDRYFQLLARQRRERRCAGCHRKLPTSTHELRQYCTPECRANAKMRRFRDRQRQAVDRPKHLSADLG